MAVKDILREAQNQALAAEIKRRMGELGIETVTMLAARMGVMVTASLHYIVKGKSRPAPKTMARLAKALQVDKPTLIKILHSTPKVLTAPPEDRERAIVLDDDPPKKVTSEFVDPKPPAHFALSMEQGGTMRLVLDVGGLAPVEAFKLVDQLRLTGLFG